MNSRAETDEMLNSDENWENRRTIRKRFWKQLTLFWFPKIQPVQFFTYIIDVLATIHRLAFMQFLHNCQIVMQSELSPHSCSGFAFYTGNIYLLLTKQKKLMRTFQWQKVRPTMGQLTTQIHKAPTQIWRNWKAGFSPPDWIRKHFTAKNLTLSIQLA